VALAIATALVLFDFRWAANEDPFVPYARMVPALIAVLPWQRRRGSTGAPWGS
jgi:hypothetical protein